MQASRSPQRSPPRSRGGTGGSSSGEVLQAVSCTPWRHEHHFQAAFSATWETTVTAGKAGVAGARGGLVVTPPQGKGRASDLSQAVCSYRARTLDGVNRIRARA